jgi:hypothetical protein
VSKGTDSIDSCGAPNRVMYTILGDQTSTPYVTIVRVLISYIYRRAEFESQGVLAFPCNKLGNRGTRPRR